MWISINFFYHKPSAKNKSIRGRSWELKARSFWHQRQKDFEILCGWLMPRAAQEAARKLIANSMALRGPLLPPPLHPMALAAR